MIKLFYSDKSEKSYSVIPVVTNYTTLQPFFTSQYHIHPVYHMVFIFDGTGQLEFDRHTVTLSEGDIILINPDEKHIFKTKDSELNYFAFNFILIDCTGGAELLKNCISLYDIQYRNEIGVKVENVPLEGILDIKTCSSSVMYNKSSWKAIKKDIQFFHGRVGDSLRDIYLERMRKDSYGLRDYFIEVYDFLFAIYKNYLSASDKLRRKPEEPIILQILLYLDRNIAVKLDLNRLAEELNYNGSYISRLFKDKMKLTISEYLNMLRIKKACELLRNSNKSITDIALVLGYNSSQHFSRSFKAVKLITPSEYRSNIEYF